MKSDHKIIVSNVFTEIIEKLAFMFSEEAGKEEFINNGSHFIQAEITFAGAMTGTLKLVVTEKMSIEISYNILGIDPDDKIEMTWARDALKEVLNVTCGNVLTALSGEKSIFNLSVPSISEIDVTEWKTILNDSDSIRLLVDDNPVLLHFYIES